MAEHPSLALGSQPPPAGKGPSLRERLLLTGVGRTPQWPGVAVSVLAHVAMFGGALLYAHMAPPRVVPQRPIVAKLVRLGKPRDEKLLPRLPTEAPPASAPPPSRPAAPAKPTPAPPKAPAKAAPAPAPAKPEPKRTEKAEKPDHARERQHEALDRQRRLMEALDRLGPPPPPGPTAKKAEPLEGRADGDPAGDALRAEEGDRYLALVQKALRDGYVLPTTISAQELLRLSCEVFIRIAADGRISQARIQAPSGNAQFDRAIESALARLTLPPPPKGFLERYPDGLAIRYKP